MTPSRLRVGEITTAAQREAWDQLSARSAVGHMHQCPWWAEPLDRYGLRSMVLGCWKDDRLMGGALFRAYPVPFTGATITECLDGPIFLEWEPAWTDSFVAGLAKVAHDSHSMALVIKNCPRKDVHADIVTAFDRLGLRTTLTPGGADAVLALEGRTVENIRKGFNHGTKWRINKGQRAALRIRRLTEGQDLREAYKAWIATAARKGFSDVRPWEAIEPVLRRCVDTRLGSVLASFLEERLLAAAFVAQVGNTATWVYGGFVDGAEQYNPTHVLQFEAIRECLEKGLGAYNFGSLISYGQPTRNGVDEFKLGFGAEAREHLDTITWQRKPTLCWLVERLRHGRIGRHLEALLKRRLTGHRDRDNQATA